MLPWGLMQLYQKGIIFSDSYLNSILSSAIVASIL